MMQINERIRAIKGELRLAMNGVASAAMREAGFNYKWNFGVELPRLQAIAADIEAQIAADEALSDDASPVAVEQAVSASTPNPTPPTSNLTPHTSNPQPPTSHLTPQNPINQYKHRLAQALWHEPIRECKLLALMLMPADSFDSALAEVWVEQIDNIELARMAVMLLYVRLPYAVDMAFRWIASDAMWRQVCGLTLMTRLLMNGTELSERAMRELRDQAESLIAADKHFVADSANRLLSINT